jgi:hypothetical protein
MRAHHHILLPLIPLLISSSFAHAQAVSLRTVAISGAPSPIPGASFAALSDPILAPDGLVSFWATLSGPDITTSNDSAWFSERSGSLSTLAREGQLFDDATITAIPSLAMNDARVGLIVLSLQSPATGTNTNLALAFSNLDSGSEGTLSLIRRDPTGQPPTFNIPARPSLPSPPLPVYWSEGLALRRSDLPDPIVPRSPVPGITALGGSETWRFNGIGDPHVNPLGEAVFWASAGPTGTSIPTNAPQKTGLWRIANNQTSLLVGEGLQVTGSPPGQLWSSLGSHPRILADGTVLLWAKLAGTGVSSGNDSSLIEIAPSGTVRGRLDAGQLLPGSSSLRLGPIPANFSANLRGQVALVAPIRSTPSSTNAALILTDHASTTIIAREGDPAPGLPTDITLTNLQTPAINPSGRLAFLAQLRGTPITPSNNRVLLATTRDGSLIPVVRTGSPFATPEGSTKTIRRIIFQQESGDTGHAAFSTGGRLTFALEFTDNTHAIVLASIDCIADFNADASVDGDDIIDFFTAWDSATPTADLDASGSVDGDDITTFFEAWDQGC